MINGTPEDMATATHVVQQPLTPVFLLSGIAALLNVFASRLARVADQADVLSREARCASRDQQVRSLKLRSRALDASVVLADLAAILTCAAVLVLFLGGVRGSAGAEPLFLAFGGAMILTMGSITTFVVEMLLAARGVRSAIDRNAGADP